MIEKLMEFDWEQAFAVSDIRSLPGSAVSLVVFTRDDVEGILSSAEGENDGPDWIMVGALKDGRVFFLKAGCDCTGWDCRSGGSFTVASTLEELMATSIPEEDLVRMRSAK